MATAEQMEALMHAHFRNESDRFIAIALQVADYEAKKGHTVLADSVRRMVDSEEKKRSKVIQIPSGLGSLLHTEEPQEALNELVLKQNQKKRIKQIIYEYRMQTKLKTHGLKHRRKILLVGPPSTGKAMTARVLAHELHLPLHIIRIDKLVSRHIEETSSKLRIVFDLVAETAGIYLFDEFDAIVNMRSQENGAGNVRRVLNTFLQFIELDLSDSILVAAVDRPKLLNRAFIRRFDDVIYYNFPDGSERKKLVSNLLGSFRSRRFSWTEVLKYSSSLSHAEIKQACYDALKCAILADKKRISSSDLIAMLEYRCQARVDMYSV
jgi:SpoVK/Ycf46/Vps4 family AAA+-type ATPase